MATHEVTQKSNQLRLVCSATCYCTHVRPHTGHPCCVKRTCTILVLTYKPNTLDLYINSRMMQTRLTQQQGGGPRAPPSPSQATASLLCCMFTQSAGVLASNAATASPTHVLGISMQHYHRTALLLLSCHRCHHCCCPTDLHLWAGLLPQGGLALCQGLQHSTSNTQRICKRTVGKDSATSVQASVAVGGWAAGTSYLAQHDSTELPVLRLAALPQTPQ